MGHWNEFKGGGVDDSEETQVDGGDVEGFGVIGFRVDVEFSVGVDDSDFGQCVAHCSTVQSCAVLFEKEKDGRISCLCLKEREEVILCNTFLFA